MQLRKLLSAYKTRFFPKKLKKEKVQLLGRELLVYESTVLGKADKDDAWFLALAQHHHVIFDIGCNLGYTSVLSSIADAAKQIVLVDPNKEALEYAEGNLSMNNMGANKVFICCFIGDKAGEKVKFYTIGTGSAGSMFTSHAVSAKAVNSWFWVDAKTLDGIVEETGKVPDLVKIDVEAAESKVMMGSVKLAALQKTKFFVEMHAPPEMPMLKNATLILDWCKAYNYKAFYLRDHIELRDPRQLADRGRCHLLLIPHAMHYPGYLMSIAENSPLPQNLPGI